MNKSRPLKLKKCYEVEFSQTGNLLVTVSRDVVLWDVPTRKKRFRAHPLSNPSYCAVDPSEDHIVVKNTTGQISIIDSVDGALHRTIDRRTGNEGSNILYSPSGEHLVDGSWDGQLTVRSATTGAIEFEKAFPDEMIMRITYNPVADKWFVAHQIKLSHPGKPDYLSIWDWPFSEPSDLIEFPKKNVRHMAVSPDASMLCITDTSTLHLVDLSSRTLLDWAPLAFCSGSLISWSPDSSEIAFVERGGVTFCSTNPLRKTHLVPLDYPSAVNYSPDGKLVALGDWTSGLLMDRAAVAPL